MTKLLCMHGCMRPCVRKCHMQGVLLRGLDADICMCQLQDMREAWAVFQSIKLEDDTLDAVAFKEVMPLLGEVRVRVGARLGARDKARCMPRCMGMEMVMWQAPVFLVGRV